MRYSVGFAALLSLTACAAHTDMAGPSSGLSNSSQNESATRALILRREADTLREMAERREREAQILSRDPTVDQDLVLQKRQLAQRLLEAAKDADREAAALGRQVPHGMVQ